jgi:hypothetical protein
VNSPNGDLGAKIVPASPGFALSQDPSERSGPMNTAGFNSYIGSGTRPLTCISPQNDAILFATSWVPGGAVTSKADLRRAVNGAGKRLQQYGLVASPAASTLPMMLKSGSTA